MKAPKGLLDRNGRAGKIVAILRANDNDLTEYPYPTSDTLFPPEQGHRSTCFAIASPKDIISINLVANKGTADVVDVEVDGIIRNSIPITQTTKSFTNVNVKKVLHRGMLGATSKKEVAKMFEMAVKERDTSRDVKLTSDATPSAVGSIVLKCWRINTLSETSSAITQAVAVGAESSGVPPTYESHCNWYDLNRNISSDSVPPPFEIQFINPTKTNKTKAGLGPKERVDEIAARKAGDYTLFAEFVFHLRSTTDLNSFGYQNIPTYDALESPAKKDSVERFPSPKDITGNPEREPKPEVEVNPDAELFADFDEKDPIPTFKSFKRHEDNVMKTPKSLAELLPRPTPKDIFKSTTEAESLESSHATTQITPEVGNRTEIVLGDKEFSSQIEERHSTIAQPNIEPARSTNFEEIPRNDIVADPTEPYSNKESGDQVAMKVIPIQKPFVSGLPAAPAHHAWLERDSTEGDLESRSSIPAGTLSQLLRDDVSHGICDVARSRSVFSGLDTTEAVEATEIQPELSSPGHSNQDQHSSNISGWISQIGQSNDLTIEKSEFLPADASLTGSSRQLFNDKPADSTEYKFQPKIKRSLSELSSESPSEATEVVPETEIIEMVNRSHRSPENPVCNSSFMVSTGGSIYHSRLSPILGSSFNLETSSFTTDPEPTSVDSVGLRFRSPGPPAEQEMESHWLKNGAEIAQSLNSNHNAITERAEKTARFLDPIQPGSWRRHESEVHHGGSPVELARLEPQSLALLHEKLGDSLTEGVPLIQSVEKLSDLALKEWKSSDFFSKEQKHDALDVDLSNKNPLVGYLTNSRLLQNTSFELPSNATHAGMPYITRSPPGMDSDLAPPNTSSFELSNHKRKADEMNDNYSRKSAAKIKKLKHEWQLTEVVSGNLQDAPVDKRNEEYMTSAADEYCTPSSKNNFALDLAKMATTTVGLAKNNSAARTGPKTEDRSDTSIPIPNKKKFDNELESRHTPERAMTPDEISAKRKATQERIAAAAKRKKALQKELEDAQVLRNHLKEIRKMEREAAEAERENEELQAQIEAVFDTVEEA